jgi:hypothetical protein
VEGETNSAIEHALPRTRWGYGASIANFLTEDPQRIIGALTTWYSFAVDPSQKVAWLEQISILQELLSPYATSDGALFFEYDIPRLGSRVDTVLILEHVLFVLEFKVGATACACASMCSSAAPMATP